MPRGRGRINRFTVMAMLQAARAQSLGLPRDSAYSWGLNRAIFYAAAKRGFRGGGSAPAGAPDKPAEHAPPPPARDVYRLGDDEAYRDPKADQLLFTIGDHDQTPEDFEHQIAARFGSKENFRAAWDEAMHIVGTYDWQTLESRQHFFNDVYKTRRDDLAERWAQRFGEPPKNQ